MEMQNQTPEDFGLKIRQDPNSLIVTARNKMRTGTIVSRPITVSGRLLETPRLKNRQNILKENEELCKKFLVEIDLYCKGNSTHNDSPSANIWCDIPKKYIVNLVKGFDSHPWHLNFQSTALSEFIEQNEELEIWDVAIPFGSVKELYRINLVNHFVDIEPQLHLVSEDENQLLISGTHVKVGAGSSTRIGLSTDQIWKIKNNALANGEKINDKTYLIKERKPILMIHIVKTKPFENKVLIKCPEFIFAIGVGFPKSDKKDRVANYVVNGKELKSWAPTYDDDEEQDDDVI